MAIAPGELCVANNVDPGNIGTHIELQTNSFGIGLIAPTTVYVYDVNISFQSKGGKTIVFTKKGKDDHIVNMRRERCIKAYKELQKMQGHFLGDPKSCWYDGQSILFSKKDFFEEAGNTHALFPIPGYAIDEELNGIDISFEIKQSEKRMFKVDIDSVVQQTANIDLSTNDRAINQFMELAINQYAIMDTERHKVFENGKSFMCHPLAEGFSPEDIPEVGDGKRLFVGTKKAIRPLEGPKGRGYNNPVLIVDALKAAFHEEMLVIQKAWQIMRVEKFSRISDSDLQKLRSILRGLACKLTYGKERTIEIFDISSHTAASSRFDSSDGSNMTIQQYFEKAYDVQLQYPTAPLIVTRERGRQTLYPMELAKIIPFQRVTIPQQTSEQSQNTTRQCAVPPATRITNIKKGAQALEILNPDNEYIKNAGLKIYSNPLMAKLGRVLPGAKISYGPNSQTISSQGKWRPQRNYISPASVNVWAIYRINGHPNDMANIRQFGAQFWKKMNEKGMRMPEPADIRMINENAIEATLRDAASHKCKYVLVITPDTITSLHKKLKLIEHELNMVIQDLKASTVNKIMTKNQTLTLENIANKTNVKLGGLNYGIDVTPYQKAGDRNWLSSERLIIGIGMSHPPPGIYGETLPPTAVGYSANVKANPNEFVGDFVLQAGRVVYLDEVISDIFGNVINLYRQEHNGSPPKEVIIYRAGIDEGSYAEVIKSEIPKIKHSLFELSANFSKLTYIIGQREQPLRFFAKSINVNAKPTEQNIPPGVVVDQQMVHPSFKEFFLNSHITLQGSANTPRYNVLVDELDMTMNELEGLTFALAHHYQIISQTISLPSPLYCANLYATRGRDLFQEYWANLSEDQKREPQDWKKVSQQLNYENTNFSTTRVNA